MTLNFIWLHLFSAPSVQILPLVSLGCEPLDEIRARERLILYISMAGWLYFMPGRMTCDPLRKAGIGVWLRRPEVRRYVPVCERVLGFVMKLWGWNHSLLRGVVARHVLSQGCHIYSVIRDQKLVYLSCDPGRLIDTSGVARVSALLQFSQGLDSWYRCHSLYISVFLFLRLFLAHSHASFHTQVDSLK